MKKGVGVVICLITCGTLFAQGNNTREEVVTKQCSAIRELVHAAWNDQFSMILADKLRSSNGYQPQGTWQFATTRYSSAIEWQGASITYIEHYEESTDSTHKDQWQYIAEYSHVPDVLEAERLFTMLNNEIEGCIYPVNDSVDLEFRPLPPEQLPPDRPSALEVAMLYELPLADSITAVKTPGITLMVGMEKRGRDYRVSLIVENMIIDNRTGATGRISR